MFSRGSAELFPTLGRELFCRWVQEYFCNWVQSFTKIFLLFQISCSQDIFFARFQNIFTTGFWVVWSYKVVIVAGFNWIIFFSPLVDIIFFVVFKVISIAFRDICSRSCRWLRKNWLLIFVGPFVWKWKAREKRDMRLSGAQVDVNKFSWFSQIFRNVRPEGKTIPNLISD